MSQRKIFLKCQRIHWFFNTQTRSRETIKIHTKFSGHMWTLANSVIRRHVQCEGAWLSSRESRKPWLFYNRDFTETSVKRFYCSVYQINRSKQMAKVELTPLRAWDDFFPGWERFAKPDTKDLARWNNRLVNNLLYYQTNYLLLAVAIFLVVG